MAKIFFDFDGVLVRSRFSDKSFLWQKGIDQALKIPPDVLGGLFQQPEWGNIISGRSDFRKKLENVFRKNGLSITPDEFIHYWLDNDLNWYHDVLEFAARLRGVGHSLYIATNQDALRTSYIWSQTEIRAIFRDIFASCELGICKPNPEFYQKIRNEKFANPNELLIVVDDDQKNVDAAIASGWKGIKFNPDLETSDTVASLERALGRITT